MIPVTKSYLPPLNEYETYLKKIWETGWLTNNGQFVQELEDKLRNYLDTQHLYFVTNGTIALQLAIKALNIEGEIITTPFSFVATCTSILWENCKPIFVDIERNTFNIDPDLIEAAITEKTQAILATHVFGYPCDVEKIEQIAKKHSLKVIYDGAHTFGSFYKGKSLLSYGDVSTVSFHATKIFHTIEGGAVIVNNPDIIKNDVGLMRSFGQKQGENILVGINAKTSEFNAAMGLCNLPKVQDFIAKRRILSESYDKLLLNIVDRPKEPKDIEYNYSYYPVLFKSECEMLRVKKELEIKGVFTRRYFYPSLHNLPYLNNVTSNCPVSEDVSCRILCLPLYQDLEVEDTQYISSLIKENVDEFLFV